ncbi:MAG: restriction endonuclease subunit S [Candidatus Cloacimonetes bacterium]|nr:restriction endonuclease subunit S [Candidatus Cloacimonadota bacterium]
MRTENWEHKPIFKAIKYIKTGVHPYEGKKKYFSTGSIQINGLTSEGEFSYNDRPSRANRIVKKGDILQARMKDTNKPVFVDDDLDSCLFSTGFMHFRPLDNSVNPRFVYYYLQSPHFLQLKDDGATGCTQISINDANLSSILFPLPPLGEQEQIVEKLDVILPKVRQLKVRLEKIPILLKRFRQSVLSAACSGVLLENYDTYNHDKWVEVIRMLENDANDSIDGFPDHWIMVDLKRLSEGFQYGTSKKSELEGLVPVIRMGNLQNGEIDWSNLKYSSDDSDIEKYALSDGDVLFNRTNSPDLVGKTSIFQGQTKAIFAGYIIKIKNRRELLLSEYLNYCLNSNYGRQWCKEVRIDGVGQSNINATMLSTFLIPLPPIEEQKEIVRQVQQLLKLADTIHTKYQTAIAHINKIEQSLLAKIFYRGC